MDAAVENMEPKKGEFLEEHPIGDHCGASDKDHLKQKDVSTDRGSEDDSTSTESSSDDEAESIIWWFKKRSFANRGGGDADVNYDSDSSTDTVIVHRPSKKEALPSSKNETVLRDDPKATVIQHQEKQPTSDQQLDSLCEQMEKMKMEHHDRCKTVKKPLDQATSGNMFKRGRDDEELDQVKAEEALIQSQKKQIAHEIFQEWLQTDHKLCDGEDPSPTERSMLRPEAGIVPGH